MEGVCWIVAASLLTEPREPTSPSPSLEIRRPDRAVEAVVVGFITLRAIQAIPEPPSHATLVVSTAGDICSLAFFVRFLTHHQQPGLWIVRREVLNPALLCPHFSPLPAWGTGNFEVAPGTDPRSTSGHFAAQLGFLAPAPRAACVRRGATTARKWRRGNISRMSGRNPSRRALAQDTPIHPARSSQ